MKRISNGRAKKSTAFNPSHQDLAQAVLDFQKKGGQITRINNLEADFGKFVNQRDERAVDDFLMTTLDGYKF